MIKTKKFDFNFKPLQLNVNISVEGSVPEKQNYDAEAREYTPDYTLTPLVLQPNVSVMDKDEVLTAGSVNFQLANITWHEICGGTSTLIENTNLNYEIVAGGEHAGRIKVKKNAEPMQPITLRFSAQYPDTRTGQIYNVFATVLIRCSNATALRPVLTLDAADQTIYNPLTDVASQTVHARLAIGHDEVDAANRVYVWEIYRHDTDTWTAAGSDSVLDYFVTVAADTASCVVNRALMGSGFALRCRAKYDSDGNPNAVTLDNSSPAKTVTFIRRIPRYEYEATETPTNIPVGLKSIAPKAAIWDVNGPIENAENELLPLWYAAADTASGNPAVSGYALIGHGQAPILPTSRFSEQYGGIIGLDVIDRGPWRAMTDNNGKVITDNNGKVIVIH